MSKILIVDDSLSERHVLSEILNYSGHEVVISRGDELQAQLGEQLPHLVIAEYHLMADSPELASYLSQSESSPGIPFLFVSSSYSDVVSEIGIEHAGRIDCIEGPVKKEELLFKATALLNKRSYDDHVHMEADAFQESAVPWSYPSEQFSGKVLAESEDWFHSPFHQASDGILLLKPNPGSASTIVDVNDVACSLHGYSRDELIGKPISFLDAPECRLEPLQVIDAIMEGRAATFEVLHVRKDGSTFPVEVNARMIALRGKQYIQAIDRDVTARKKIENELGRLQRRLNAQWGISGLVDADRETVCDRVLEEIVSMTDSEYGFYGFIDKEERSCTIHSWSSEALADCDILIKPMEHFIHESGLWGNAIRDRQTLIVNDYDAEYPNENSTPEGHVDIRKLMVIPVFNNRRIVAVGAVANKMTDYCEEDAEHVEKFLQSAQVIQDKKVVEEELQGHRIHLMELVEERTAELQKANERLALEVLERKQTELFSHAVNELLKLFPQKVSMKDYLDAAVGLILGWCSSGCAGLRILNDYGYMPYESYEGLSSDFRRNENWLSVEKDSCVCTRIVKEQTTSLDASLMTESGSFVCDNTYDFMNGLSEEEKEGYREMSAAYGHRSIAVIPIRYRRSNIGIIHLSDERKGMVPVSEIKLLETLTPFIGEAVHKFRIEEELRANCELQRESTELFEQMFSSIHLMIAYIDADFKFIRVNRAFSRAFHKEVDYFNGRNFFKEFFDEDNKKIFAGVVESGEAFYAYEEPMEYLAHSSQDLNYWDWTLQPVKDLRGNVNSLLFSMVDVTQRKRAEADALRSSQLASLGELAAGVAHEINNPINGIINYSQILVNKSHAGTRENDILTRIIKEGDRIAGIVKNLLAFARSRGEEKSPVHVYVLVSEVLSLSGAQLKKDNIRIDMDIPKDLPVISAQPQHIEQVILNLISNARYSLNEKYPRISDDKIISITGAKVSRGNDVFVRLTVYDNGIGIPSSIMDKIMNPFFSTKPSGEGTGLGLSISQNIVDEHNGRISVSSVEGEFARLDLLFPVNLS